MNEALAFQTSMSRSHPAAMVRPDRPRQFRPSQTIAPEGAPDTHVYFLRTGWAYCARMLADGRRQILHLYLPGEIAFLRPVLSAHRQSPLCAFSTCEVASVPRAELLETLAHDPALAAATEDAAVRQDAIREELLISLGRRNALERTSYLICEILIRRAGEGAQSCEWPLTQADLSDVLGLSVIHINRTLQVLRGQGLIEISRGRLTVHDLAGLSAACGFEAGYLRPTAPMTARPV